MTLFLRATLLLAGIGFLLGGVGFLIDPASPGANLGLSPSSAAEFSTIRADFFSYFAVAGGALLIGAWKRKGDLLLVAAALVGLTFFGRCYSLVIDGFYEGWFLPMSGEAAVFIVAVIGSRVLPHQAMAPED